jgi:phospholipid transport system substrate-binding protein
VKSKISESSSQPEIQIDWRVYTKDPLKPLIRDLVVEGLSLARTQKEEFSSILSANNNDVNFLFARLEKFIAN